MNESSAAKEIGHDVKRRSVDLLCFIYEKQNNIFEEDFLEQLPTDVS